MGQGSISRYTLQGKISSESQNKNIRIHEPHRVVDRLWINRKKLRSCMHAILVHNTTHATNNAERWDMCLHQCPLKIHEWQSYKCFQAMHCLEAMYECYNAPRTKKKQTERLNATTIIRRSRPTSPDVLIFLVLESSGRKSIWSS